MEWDAKQVNETQKIMYVVWTLAPWSTNKLPMSLLLLKETTTQNKIVFEVGNGIVLLMGLSQ